MKTLPVFFAMACAWQTSRSAILSGFSFRNIFDVSYFGTPSYIYNTVCFHSAIGYITPTDKLEGREKVIF